MPPDYELCFLDDSGRTTASTAFSARDDDEARRLSQDAAERQPAALWRQGRLVARFPDD